MTLTNVEGFLTSLGVLASIVGGGFAWFRKVRIRAESRVRVQVEDELEERQWRARIVALEATVGQLKSALGL